MPSSIGSILTSTMGGLSGVPTWMKGILGGLTGVGAVSNILANKQRSNLLGDLQKQSAKWNNLTPQQLSQLVAGATQPLDRGLEQGVSNIVQGEMGERGLAQAPGIWGADLAQALAPYYQQNQNTALQEVLAQMGLPISYANSAAGLLPGQTDLSPMLALLMASLSKPGGGAGGTVGIPPSIGIPSAPQLPGIPNIPSPVPLPPPTGGGGDTGDVDFFGGIG